jgi:hypothetical protein
LGNISWRGIGLRRRRLAFSLRLSSSQIRHSRERGAFNSRMASHRVPLFYLAVIGATASTRPMDERVTFLYYGHPALRRYAASYAVRAAPAAQCSCKEKSPKETRPWHCAFRASVPEKYASSACVPLTAHPCADSGIGAIHRRPFGHRGRCRRNAKGTQKRRASCAQGKAKAQSKSSKQELKARAQSKSSKQELKAQLVM